MSIPVVTLPDLLSDDPAVQARVAEAIQIAFGRYGLLYIREHGIERADVLETYDAFLDVLERPTEEKATWGGPGIWYQRGWTPPNTEQAVVAGGQPDFKECYFACPTELDASCKAAWPEIYAENVWPEGDERFQRGVMGIGSQIHTIGLAILAGCERALGLEPGDLAGRCDGAPHVTRVLKYLPLGEDQVGTGILWGEEHTDFNLLTLLPGGAFYRGRTPDSPEDAGGLWLRTRPTAEHPRGEMVRGRAPEGCIVAQVGQQLEVLTAGRLTATPHVIRAPGEPGWTRCSLAHFIHLHGRQLVEPLEVFRADPNATAYLPPVLAGNYAMKTLVDIGLAPESTVDLLGYRQYDRLASFRAVEDR
ncbi:MAG: isopenicillin N synthase family oxygenase [Alphaproteobacteria bacterium]|nr:isopenicillin N synthase family oxygenase [Alphaproteobacteria bacterium]